MNYKYILKTLGIFFLCVLTFNFNLHSEILTAKANYTAETISSGNWSDASIWSGNKVPDPLKDKCRLSIYHNVDYYPGEDPWTWSSNNEITIKSGAVLTVYADLNIDPNFDFKLEEGAKLIVMGDLYFQNNVDGVVNGEIYVSGNLEVDGGNSSLIMGSGSIVVDGEITDDNDAIDFSLVNSIHRWLIVDRGAWDLNTSWSYKKDGPPSVSPPNHQCIVHIPGGLTGILDINTTIRRLDIEEGGILQINPTFTLTVSHNICNEGELLIKSDVSGTAGLIYDQADPVLASAEKYIFANNYNYIASPFEDAPVSVFTTTTWGAENPNFYIYDETEQNEDWMYGWKQTLEENLMPGMGYALYSFENFTPVIIKKELINEEFSFPVTNTLSAGGSRTWNLIGNPYPCHINADQLIEQNTDKGIFSGSLYFWENNNDGEFSVDDYMIYTLGGGTGGNASIANGIIAPFTGFFVQADQGGDFVFPQSIKCEAAIIPEKSISGFDPGSLEMIRLSVSSENGLYNDILLKFTEYADEDIDIFDGLKLRGNKNIAFYSLLNDKEYAIQGLPYIDNDLQIQLGLDVEKEGVYKISAEMFINIDKGTQLYLEDKSEKKVINLKKDDYYFTAKGKLNNRFVLYFDDQFLIASSSIEDNLNSESEIKINTLNKTIFIFNPYESLKAELYDLTGRSVYEKVLSEGNTTIDKGLRRGYYLLRLSDHSQNYTKKIFIQ